jgi:hypothetical protein
MKIKYYKQIKELPFSRIGSLWQIEGDQDITTRLLVNGTDYSHTYPSLWTGLVKYYTDDNGVLDMESDWFTELKPVKED